MLTYLYTLDYDDGDGPQAVALAASQNTESLVADSSSKPQAVDDATASHCKRMNNVRVYTLAEKYNIAALKELAKTKFENCKSVCVALGRKPMQSSTVFLVYKILSTQDLQM